MQSRTIMAAAALVALAGCDRLGLGQGSKLEENQAAAGNSSNAIAEAGGKPTGNSAAPADAGVTTSRSLAGLLGGGGSDEGGGSEEGAGSEGAGGKDPAATPVSSGASFDRSMLVGSWADDESCNQAILLEANGRFYPANGGEGTWRLNGDRLTLTGPAGNYVVRIQSLDGGVLTVVNPDGSIGRSRRC